MSAVSRRSSGARTTRRAAIALAVVTGVAGSVAGCQTFRQIAALERVQFTLQSLSDVDLAGVRLDHVRSYQDLAPAEVLRILASVAEGRLPLSMHLNVRADNPAANAVTARLVRLDWTLFLEDRETVSGSVAEEVAILPGESVVVPVQAGLDLLRFFSESGPDLVDLVLALSGEGGGEPKEIALRATPTIETVVGPIRYPGAITIVRADVGS